MKINDNNLKGGCFQLHILFRIIFRVYKIFYEIFGNQEKWKSTIIFPQDERFSVRHSPGTQVPHSLSDAAVFFLLQNLFNVNPSFVGTLCMDPASCKYPGDIK